MAFLVRIRVVRWLKAGKRVLKGTPGAKRASERSAKWYGVGIPGYPPKKRFPLATDKEAAKRMLANMIRGAERGQAGVPDREAARLPLAGHLKRFESDLAAGLARKGGRRLTSPDPKQVALIVQRVRDLLAGCGFIDPPDLNVESPAKLARYLSGRLGMKRKGIGIRHESGISAQSAAFYLAAARRFVRWLARIVPVAPDLFDDLAGFAPHNDRKHARREISTEELARLIETTQDNAETIGGLNGPERAVLYLTAFATGFRAGELAALTPENFDLECVQPVAILAAGQTKNRKRARQPLPPGLVVRLRPFLAGRAAGKPIWPGRWKRLPADMLKRDLVRAGIPYKVATIDGDRYADFHALRHSYLSALAATGASVKELQELARHSDPRLTLGIYTHATPAALGGAVARLQLPGGSAEANTLAKLSRPELEVHATTLQREVERLNECLSRLSRNRT